MVVTQFVADIVRFHRARCLGTLLIRLLLHPSIIVFGLACAGFLIFLPDDQTAGRMAILLFLVPLGVYVFIARACVEMMTPLYFGRSIVVRLVSLEYFRGRSSVRTTAVLLVLPTANRVVVTFHDSGEVHGQPGRAYLARAHPDDGSIIVPLIDDDPLFMGGNVLSRLDEQRRQALLAEVSSFRARQE